ncbi:DUF2490 domain-containing protein [Winogradskyella sp. PG-2]|uniref:DUF2490 domain-containing protein n=1 Tax=Winogradskyella sp. PG-2 TaxID=754409 RepID=UPI0004586E1B|nr:DUF2490 domain-containing protein [Winogradskyella sp. PG-2]BAO75879.1 hypothetical protein WPG_1649 [Winogradskyella sp. PG-2]
MSTPCINRLLFLAALIYSYCSFSQNNFETLGESGFAINKTISGNYKINFAVRSRYYLYRDNEFGFENRQIDLAQFSSFKLNYNNSFSLGIQYRFRETFDGGSNELRLTQQFNYTKKVLATRFAHRFRFEQRILERLTIFRSRYRFAIDFPLNGEKLDVGESYLVTSMEALLSQSSKIKSEIDHRTTAQFGWLISEKLKLQIGLEYRFEAFNINTEERLFFLTSASLKI